MFALLLAAFAGDCGGGGALRRNSRVGASPRGSAGETRTLAR